jgi:trk system potassium uptake protein TrkA
MQNKRFLVIGLGILGQTVARTLAQEGSEVIALDSDPLNVERIKDQVAVAVQGDSTDPRLLEQVGCKSLDAAVICIGENFAGSVLTTAHLLDQKVRYVAVRAMNQLHADIFTRMGAHEVFFVESEMGRTIAHRLQSPALINELDLGDGFGIIEWSAPAWMHGKKIVDLALRKNFGTQIIGLRDPLKTQSLVMPTPEMEITEGLQLLLVGADADLRRIMNQ